MAQPGVGTDAHAGWRGALQGIRAATEADSAPPEASRGADRGSAGMVARAELSPFVAAGCTRDRHRVGREHRCGAQRPTLVRAARKGVTKADAAGQSRRNAAHVAAGAAAGCPRAALTAPVSCLMYASCFGEHPACR